MEVDDIEIYGGVASHEDKVPPVGLEGRELPRPFRCWATTNTEDTSRPSTNWRTRPGGPPTSAAGPARSRRPRCSRWTSATASQLAPTKLRISSAMMPNPQAPTKASRRQSESFDCPRFLMLEGAVDGEDRFHGRYESHRGAPRSERTRRSARGVTAERP